MRKFSTALALAGALGLAGCSSAVIVDHIPTAVGGLPEKTPERPATPLPFPAVFDLPPSRGPTVLTEGEKKRLRDDLTAARERAEREAANPSPETTATTPAGAATN